MRGMLGNAIFFVEWRTVRFSKARLLVSSLLLAVLLMISSGAFAATLTVLLEGLRNAQGSVAIAVYSSADGFPADRSKAVKKLRVVVPQGASATTMVIPDMPAGTYAIAAFHDENNSGKLETNFFGMPLKGYGFSNDPRPTMRAARFDEARFSLDADAGTQTLTIIYP